MTRPCCRSRVHPSTAAVVVRMTALDDDDRHLVRVLVNVGGHTELIGPLVACCGEIDEIVLDVLRRICGPRPPLVETAE